MQLGVYVAVAAVIGGAVGGACRKTRDVLYWTLLTNILVYLAIAGGRLPNEAVVLAWSGVGATCGAVAAVGWPMKWVLGILCSAFLGLGSFVVGLLSLGEQIVGLIWFDVACAGFVGGLLRPVIVFLDKFLQQSKQPRLVMAAWLCMCILVGNFLVPIIGGVER